MKLVRVTVTVTVLQLAVLATTAATAECFSVPASSQSVPLAATRSTTRSTTRIHASPPDEEPSSWDEDVDYDKVWSKKEGEKEDMMPGAAWDDVVPSSSKKETNLDISPVISELLDAETAADLKREAREIIENRVSQGMEQLAEMRKDMKKDVESRKRTMERQSEVRAEREGKQLMNKIDQITGNFLSDSKQQRDATKMAAAADAAMEGQGVDVGSWGSIGGAVVTMGGANSGLLGSVENAKKQQQQAEAGVDLPPTASRILIVADESGDQIAKQLVPKFKKSIQDIMSVDVQVVKPTQQMPLGGNNAACIIFFLTSLSNPPRALLERLMRRTMDADGKVARPPTQLVAVSTVGTERTDKYPYSMQNLLSRKLEGRRDMEESLINAVAERKVEPPLDYTIVKFGELKDSKEDFSFMPGDVLDGTTPLDTAANVLVQAVAFQPSARNTTLCAVGKLPETIDNLLWDDSFLKLDGPELARYESLVPAELFVQLVEYLKEWGMLLAESRKLTTPIEYDISVKGPNAAFEGVAQRDGLKLLFRPTNTGADYLSKEEERELEKRGASKSTTATRRLKREGGVEIMVEITTGGALRVRAARCNMGPATVVKELSESSILKQLKKGLDVFVREYA